MTGDIRGYVDGFYLLAQDKQDSQELKDSGILFSDIYIKDDLDNVPVVSPVVYFRYRDSNMGMIDGTPLIHNFTRNEEGVPDYGVFSEGEEEKFKVLYQHLTDIQIDYEIYVKLDND